MIKALVTGYGPYADERDNPSGRIAARLDGTALEGIEVAGRVLPVATERVGAALARALDDTNPDVIVLTGVAPGRPSPSIERVAVNVRDFPLPDVDGREPIDEPVRVAGPDAYLSTLPVKAILARWRELGIPGFVSNSAGTFLCNQVFYLARHLTANIGTRVGFIHIPVAPDRASSMTAGQPLASLPVDLVEQAIRVAIVVAATHRGGDVRLPAGSIM